MIGHNKIILMAPPVDKHVVATPIGDCGSLPEHLILGAKNNVMIDALEQIK